MKLKVFNRNTFRNLILKLLLLADQFYVAAINVLNKTRADKVNGFALLNKAADKGHVQAKAHLAWAYILGNPFELKVDEARRTFTELADGGIPEAHMGLGFMYCK